MIYILYNVNITRFCAKILTLDQLPPSFLGFYMEINSKNKSTDIDCDNRQNVFQKQIHILGNSQMY